jgi:hypothetical protein
MREPITTGISRVEEIAGKVSEFSAWKENRSFNGDLKPLIAVFIVINPIQTITILFICFY